MKKTVQIVAVPLDKKGWNKDELLKHILKDNTQYSQVGDYKLINGGNSLNAKCWQAQQLLILSDDGIFPKDNLYGDGKLVVANNEWSGETNIEWKKVIASYPHIEGTLPISKETVQAWIDAGTPREGVIFYDNEPDNLLFDPQGNLLLEFGEKDSLKNIMSTGYKWETIEEFADSFKPSKPSIPTNEEIDRICVRGCHDFILEKGIMTPITPQQYYTAGYKKALKDLGHE
jgi:hypothetical protein